MLSKLKAALKVLQRGQEVADPATWKNRQLGVTAVTALLVAIAAASSAFGVDLGVTDAQIESAVIGGASVVGLVFNVWATLATSKKVGLPAKPE
jgi:hypothetical protein